MHMIFMQVARGLTGRASIHVVWEVLQPPPNALPIRSRLPMGMVSAVRAAVMCSKNFPSHAASDDVCLCFSVIIHAFAFACTRYEGTKRGTTATNRRV